MYKKYSKETAAEAAKEKMSQLQNKIKDISISYQDNPDIIAELLSFSSRFYNYSFHNKCLIYSQNPNATFVAGFTKWNKEYGCKINKGAKSIKILKPVFATLYRENENEPWKRLKQATKEEKEKIKSGEYETNTYTHFKPISVFDISQTDCPRENYPRFFDMGQNSERHSELYTALKMYSIEKGVPVSEQDLSSISLRGYYTPKNNSISINNLLEDTMKLSVLSHEYAHALMHNDISEKKSTEQIEFEADALSIMLETHFGMEIPDTRKRHISDNYNVLREKNSDFDIDNTLNYVSNIYNDFVNDFDTFLERDKQKQLSHEKKPIEKYCEEYEQKPTCKSEVER